VSDPALEGTDEWVNNSFRVGFVGTHFDPTEARSMLSWLKRYVDDDTRYEQFLCPPPADAGVEEYQDICPP
jgi:hypothetical protein